MMTQRGLAFDQLKQQHVAFARDQIFKEFDAPARAPHCRQTTFGKHAKIVVVPHSPDGRLAEEPDGRELRSLLRVCRQRPRGCRAAEQRDELTPF
jgi:hypothetical protein